MEEVEAHNSLHGGRQSHPSVEPRTWSLVGWSDECDTERVRPTVRLDRGAASPDLRARWVATASVTTQPGDLLASLHGAWPAAAWPGPSEL
eukprot:1009906-Alexandrium_andersonii.AAC.1